MSNNHVALARVIEQPQQLRPVGLGPGRLLLINWLQVLGATELAQIDQRVRHQFHAIVPLLDTFKAE